MAIGYIDITTHRRGHGHSAAAALAYRAGLALRDSRTGELHDYRARKSRDEVVDAGIVSSRPTPVAASEQALADAIEARERHPRAWILRAGTVAIPHELNLPHKHVLACAIANGVAKHLDTVVAWALHPPGSEGDPRNWRLHLVVPTRSLTENGHLGAKMLVMDKRTTSGEAIAGIRNLIADLVNAHLEQAGSGARMHVGRRLDAYADPSIPIEVVHVARRRTEKRTDQPVHKVPARDLVAKAVENGDIDPPPTTETAVPSRSKPRYEQHASSRSQRRTEQSTSE